MKKRLKQLFSGFRSGTRSLKTVLAVYFIPIAIIPPVFLSVYATRVFEESTKDSLVRRASSERDAIVGEIDALESELLGQARNHAKAPRLIATLRPKAAESVASALGAIRPDVTARVFTPEGRFLAVRRAPETPDRIPYLSKDGLRRVKVRGETVDRYFDAEVKGFVTVIRMLIKTSDRLLGVLEEEYVFGPRNLAELKNRRGLDVVFLSRDLTEIAATFALSDSVVKSFSALAFSPSTSVSREPIFIPLGDARFASFLYDFPAPLGRTKKWGFVAVFLSMTNLDATALKLKAAMVYLTVLLTLVAALLIFVFSNRLVRPIEMLVLAMKRIRTGRVEQIPSIDSTYEIEYLVHSFNEMARNVAGAKRALELKLEELHRANLEIKNTQSTLVQSAKMISLGQIVAGVAHELNNPIGFIYSNMHHLSDYVEKIERLVKLYRELQARLPEKDRMQVENLERAIELDYLLKDMHDLTKSCVEGANRTKEIVLGLKSFSRTEDSTFRASDLNEGLRSTVRLLSTEFKDRVRVHEELGEIPLVECNLSQMNQVFMNLLSNASHAIEGRGEIWVRTRREGDRVAVEIEDSGRGMAPEMVDKIFDPFFTTKKVGEGTGLGLSIAYGLVQKHRGRIEVRSQLKKGTRFTVWLPVTQPALQAG